MSITPTTTTTTEAAVSRRELYVVDTGIADWQSIVAAIGDGAEVLVLDAQGNGLEQLSALLNDRPEWYDALHIYSHGSEALLRLGSYDLSWHELGDLDVQSSLGVIGRSLTGQGDILLYGCDVAAGDSGVAFVEQLAALTGADVAASVDLTGSGDQGNWSLEQYVGTVEADTESILGLNTSLSATRGGWLNFNFDNEAVWLGARDLSQEILAFEAPSMAYQTGDAPGDGVYSIESSGLTAGIFLDASIGGGGFDLQYPVQYTVETPNVVHTGGQAIVDTDLISIRNPRLALDGPGVSLALTAAMAVDLSFSLDTSILGVDITSGVDFDSGLEVTLFDVGSVLSGDGELLGLDYEWDLHPDAGDAEKHSSILARITSSWL